MKSTKSISLIFALGMLSFILGFVLGYYRSANTVSDERQIDQRVEENHLNVVGTNNRNFPNEIVIQSNETATADSNIYFYMTAMDGKIVVFDKDKESIYMETDINVSGLPIELQDKLENGIEIPSENALYDLLENYSS